MEIQFRTDREAHLRMLCDEMGRTVDDFVNEVILTFMEDYEDGRDAEVALAEAKQENKFYSAEEVREQLGLDRRIHTQSTEAA